MVVGMLAITLPLFSRHGVNWSLVGDKIPGIATWFYTPQDEFMWYRGREGALLK
jgi:hypothetical protein